MPSFFEAVYEAVNSIPQGKVCTYGQVALMIGAPGAARQVGWALHCLPGNTTVPWHRVVNYRGGISLRGRMGEAEIQRERLKDEGIWDEERDCVDLERFGYRPFPDGP